MRRQLPEATSAAYTIEPIKFVDLLAQRRRLGDGIDKAIWRVLEHGHFILGPEVEELEALLATCCGARYAVSCASGTDALLLALLAWETGPGDAVFVPSFTFAATAEVVALVGATPVFCDVLEDSFNLDPVSLDAAICSAEEAGLSPTGVIAVDLFGQPADYHILTSTAARKGMWVLSDAAQSFGAQRYGGSVGTFGDATATSFYPAKPLSCYGDGGAIFTSDPDLAVRLRSLRAHGEGSERYEHLRVGINGRLDTIQAAVLIQKLTIFEEEIEARQRIAHRYHAGLARLVSVPRVSMGARSAWAQYAIRIKNRESVATTLLAEGIPTAVHYPKSLHEQPAYQDFPVAPTGLSVSTALSDSLLCLPMHPYLSETSQSYIISRLRQAVERS